MTNILSLTSEQLKRAAGLKEQIAALEKQLSSIFGSSATTASAPKKRTMSAAARAKIAAGARARWAKVKAKAAPVAKKAAAKAPAKRRPMSAAAKAKLAALAKARWAKIKAAGKKTL